jgi:mannose/fructose/N-acetylgalactosamine-specific phosphotransferase system component IID
MRNLRARIFLRSLLLQAGFSDERRQGLGFAWAIDPVLLRAYAGDPAGLAAARARHLESFNAQPYAAALPLGAAAALETRAAAGEPALAARAVALKAVLGAALSGPADAFFWGALRPLAGACAVAVAALGIGVNARGSFFWGPAFGLAVFNAPALWTRGAGLGLGLRDGEAAAAAAARLPVQVWILAARRAALVAIFAAASLVLSSSSFQAPRVIAAAAFAAGAGLARFTKGPLRLIAAAGLLGAAASAAGWTGWMP